MGKTKQIKSKQFTKLKALPNYLGGKRKLVQYIFGLLGSVIPLEKYPVCTFIDAFAGGGSVSLYAKALGFKKVISNDWGALNYEVLKGIIANNKTTINQYDLIKIWELFKQTERNLDYDFTDLYLAEERKRLIDSVLLYASSINNPIKQAMLKVLAIHLINDSMIMPTATGISNQPFADFIDGKIAWTELNSKWFSGNGIKKLLKPSLQILRKRIERINQGIFSGASIEIHNEDISTLIKEIKGEILYLDPPYPGTTAYEKNYAAFNNLLVEQKGTVDNKIIASPFSKTVDSLLDLLQKAEHIPIWILSYGNKAISKEELEAKIQAIAPRRRIVSRGIRYSHLGRESIADQEILLMAYEEGAVK